MNVELQPELPALRLEDWTPARDTLHLWAQIVGKVKLASTTPRNHFWHAALYPDVGGLTTGRIGLGRVRFAIDFDLVGHRLVVRVGDGREGSFPLADGLSVAEFDRRLHELLAGFGLDVDIVERPHGGPEPEATPFGQDTGHASYDPEAAHRFWVALDWVALVLEEFAGRFQGRQSPVHLFWHSFELVLTRFSGRPAPPGEDADPVTREAYSHEQITFGFLPGDRAISFPAFYAVIWPEPDGLSEHQLAPEQASWRPVATGTMALLDYDAVRTAADPRATLLAFLESAYEAGAGAAYWDRDELAWHQQGAPTR